MTNNKGNSWFQKWLQTWLQTWLQKNKVCNLTFLADWKCLGYKPILPLFFCIGILYLE